MGLETGIREALRAVPAITAMVGSRIRPVVVGAADALPFVTYNVTDDEGDVALDGSRGTYLKAEFELGIFGSTYDDVAALSQLARDRFDGLGEAVGGVEFAPVTFDGQSDVEQTAAEGEELPAFLRIQTYRTLYRIVA